MVDRSDVEAAAARVEGRVRETPVIAVDGADLGVPGQLSLKLELHQHTGSFKPRGAFNRMLQGSLPSAGVIAASGGNHGLAVAYAARSLGVPAEVFVPVTASPVKVQRLAGLGAQVRQVGQHYAEALAASSQRAAETGALVVHAYDQPEVVAGQGTVGRELERQVDGIDTVLVAVGGGGLVSGIASWFNGSVRVVAVEPEQIPTLHSALKAAGRSTSRWAASPPTRWVPDASARSPSTPPAGRKWSPCWSGTRTWCGPAGCSGRSCGSPPSWVARPRWPRWSVARTCRSRGSGWR
nr:pyridoxal-phosphate dependent enzyme [Micromonospora tarensis]